MPPMTMLTTPRPGARPTMTSKIRLLLLPAFLVAFAATALAGPDAVDSASPEVRQKPVVKWHKKVVDTVLVACGVIEPAPVYVAPGYLETTGPAPMLVYRPQGPLRPRRVSHPEGEEKPAAAAPSPGPEPAPVAEPASSPAPAAAPAPALPAPEPAPTDNEPGILPGTDARGSSARDHADELLSYFQRQHAVARPYTTSPVPPGGAGPNDPGAEPSFLQAPQAPEQPVLPPSRATYHVVP